jgi:hypothetical protein
VRARYHFVALLGCVALAGCASPGYSTSKVQSELERAGVTPTQARCVTDALENTIDPNKLSSHSEPNPDEITHTRELLTKCGVKPAPLR